MKDGWVKSKELVYRDVCSPLPHLTTAQFTSVRSCLYGLRAHKTLGGVNTAWQAVHEHREENFYIATCRAKTASVPAQRRQLWRLSMQISSLSFYLKKKIPIKFIWKWFGLVFQSNRYSFVVEFKTMGIILQQCLTKCIDFIGTYHYHNKCQKKRGYIFQFKSPTQALQRRGE